MTKLPIGIQTFSKIRESNYAYVDKTEDIYKLIDNGQYYFLSRPRRFGKSLLIDTIAELFQGSREYFKGLYIYDKWDWSTKCPVIKISFASGDYSSPESLKDKINLSLEDNCENLGLDFSKHKDLIRIIKAAYKKYGQKVVILVDEYDKPIIDEITDQKIARENRRVLGNFYSAIKDNDRYIKFAMLTGVSKLSQMSLFSHLNNLTDITMDKRYGTITGYTQNDLETTFKDHLQGADMDRVKEWYNGYNYFAEPIYNPFDVLKFIDTGFIFKNYWWQSGNPNFLIETLKKSNFYLPNLEELVVDEVILNAFDVERIDIIALLWQTGYLTFDKEIVRNNRITYKMKVPNLEVKDSLYALFFDYLVDRSVDRVGTESRVLDCIDSKDTAGMVEGFKSMFAAIPYHNYTNSPIGSYEGFYSSVIYTFLSALGYVTIAEDVTNRGRIDLTLKTETSIFIFEFKVDKPEEEAMKQIKERKYYQKYQAEGKDIFLIGMNFNSNERNISNFKTEQVK